MRKQFLINQLLILLLLAPALMQAQNPPKMKISDIRKMEDWRRVPVLMAARKFPEAIKLIDIAVPIFRKYADQYPQFKDFIEDSIFNKAICIHEQEQFDQSKDAFKAYLAQYNRGRHRKPALILWADAHAAKEEWDEVLKVGGRIYKDVTLNFRENLAMYGIMGEAYFQLENWQEAVEPLYWTFKNGSGDERIGAATYLTICLVRLKEFKKLYEFVPFVYNTPARYDLGLQMALVEEGDEFYDDGASDKALLLFRLVYKKSELLIQLDALLTKMERDKKRMMTQEQSTVGETLASKSRRYDRSIKRAKEQLVELKEFEDYDQEIDIRVGNCYFELERYLEALYTYHAIYEDYPDDDLAQQALYSCFTTAFAMKDIDRALHHAYEYVDAFPPPKKSAFWDTVTLNIATIHVEREEWEKAIAIAQKAIKLKPDHSVVDNMIYIIGYSRFQLSETVVAMKQFERIFEKHPRSQFLQPAQYWHAQGHLFEANYVPGREELLEFVGSYSIGPLYEDAYYRLGMAFYGEGDFTNALATFQAFVGEFPESILTSEAHAFSGDILASWGDEHLDTALEQYTLGTETAVNMVQTDYATMAMARLHELESNHEKIIELWSNYLIKHPEEGNFTEAIYWIGASYKNLNNWEKALNTFYDGVVKYGDDPHLYGIDMILRDIATEFEGLPDINSPTYDPSKVDRANLDMLLSLKQRLRDEMMKAGKERRLTLLMRLAALFYSITKEGGSDAGILSAFMRESYITNAGPISLVMMGREASKRGNMDMANRIYDHFLDEHKDSDLALEALKGVAETKLEQGKLDEAAVYLTDIANRFATMEDAAWANLRLADIYTKKRNFEAAEGLYSLVASVKEWSGDATPEALYGLGQAKIAQGKTEEATAYFENIYILYGGGYPSWGVKAYIARARALVKLGRKDDAKAILQEMVDNERLSAVPEAKEGRELIEQLR
ncbi:MAG: TolA-binding protein [Kiritimatiellia bacterium]|jgi:TolA-binding protein